MNKSHIILQIKERAPGLTVSTLQNFVKIDIL